MTKPIYITIVALSAFAMAWHSIPAESGADVWAFRLALEAMRAALLASNVELSKVSRYNYWIALTLSIVATSGIGMDIHHRAGMDDYTGSYWAEQTANALLLFCEWSLSIVVSGSDDQGHAEPLRQMGTNRDEWKRPAQELKAELAQAQAAVTPEPVNRTALVLGESLLGVAIPAGGRSNRYRVACSCGTGYDYAKSTINPKCPGCGTQPKKL